MSKKSLLLSLVLSTSFAHASLDQCITEICGSGEQNQDMREYMDGLKSSQSQNTIELERKIKESFSKVKAPTEQHAMRVEKILNNFDPAFIAQLDQEDKIILAFIHHIMPAVITLVQEEVATPYFFSSLAIDDEADIKQILIDAGYDTDEATWLDSILKNMVTDYEFSKIFGLVFSSTPEYALTSYMQQSERTNYINLHEALSQLIAMPSTHSGRLIKLLQQRLAELALSDDLDEAKASEINIFYSIAELIKYAKKPDIKEAFEMSELFLSRSIPKKIQEFKAGHSTDQLGQAELSERFIKAQENCLKKALAASSALPPKESIHNFKKFWQDLRERSFEFVERNVSPAYARLIKDKINRIQLDLPANQETFAQNLISEIEKYADQDMNTTAEDQTLMAIFGIGNTPDELSEAVYPYGELLQSCGNNSTEDIFYDYSVPTGMIEIPSIKVSWSVLKDFTRFSGVVTHEMGHQIYYLLRGGIYHDNSHSQYSFKNVRNMVSCVSSVHGPVNSEYDMWDERGDYTKLDVSQYTVEDFADHFAATLYPESSFNYACVFPDQENNQYKDLSLQNPYEEDTHSSGAFRIITMEYLTKGKLPESCKQALSAEGIQMNRCMK